MKIKITQTCECMYQRKNDPEPYDVRVDAGKELWGMVQQTVNWDNKPLPAIDLISNKECYFGIPDGCWEKLSD